MRRVAFLIMVFAFSALAWPAAVAHAHSPIHAWLNADDCEVIVRLGSHLGADHTHTSSPEYALWVAYDMTFVVSKTGQEEYVSYLLGFNQYTRNDYWESYSLRNKPYYADYGADTTWSWGFSYTYLVPDVETGRMWSIGIYPGRGSFGEIPAHCLTPPPPECQFTGGFGHWSQQHTTAGACHNNEQHVGRGSLQSTENGILFYDQESQRLGFFAWAHVWQALTSTPFAEPQPRHIYDPQPATGLSALTNCQFPGALGTWVQRYANAGDCYNVAQHVGGGSIQSAENGLLFHDPSRHRVGFFDWTRIWHALVSMPFADDSQPVTAASSAALCQFTRGFGDWVRQNPVSGTCHTNELHVSGGSLQSTENGILFYHRDSQRLEYFDWERTWQALRTLPISVPEYGLRFDTLPVQEHSASSRCQYASGYRDWDRPQSPNFNSYPETNGVRRTLKGLPDWVILRANAGLCHNHEQQVPGGTLQSYESGIVFYDQERLYLGFYSWPRVWQALAASPSEVSQTAPAPAPPAVSAVPVAPHCQFVLGFAQWAQTSPGVGACHNNELSVTGGSLQSTQNGILFYDRDNHRLGFFNWAQVWQAVAPLPFTQPQLPPSADSQTATHCQFVLGFANWVQQHADAGACHNNEQYLASGSVQSTQYGILFYDSSSQRLGYFNWEHVWQGLALLASSQ